MTTASPGQPTSAITYYVDEAGDGVLFGPRGRNRLLDPDAQQFFMLGMVCCAQETEATRALNRLREELMAHPLYSSIYSLQPEAQKTARAFHAKDDHAEVRAKVFEHLLTLDFAFYAVIKDMRAVLRSVTSRNRTDTSYHYHPSEIYDLTVGLLFEERLPLESACRVVFARRGKSDRTQALRQQLEQARQRLGEQQSSLRGPTLEIQPAYPWEQPCLQIADYCLWALQRYYERHEVRFLYALWPKVSMIRDLDDPDGTRDGTYFSCDGALPDLEGIKNRRI
jgi:hypothetical protein